MRLQVLGKGAFSRVRVELNPGETFISEAGKMVRQSAGIDMDVTTKSRGKGGLLGAMKRLVGGDSFFLATYRARGTGEVVLAPDLIGEVAVLQLDGGSAWMCSGGSFVAQGPEIGIEARWQGAKGLFSGESLFFLEATGRGPIVVSAFGAVREIAVDGEYIVDTGHVVAFENSLQYDITKAGSSWLHSFLAGEGLVMKFRGHGRLVVQSHNPTAFGRFLGPKLPPR
ncbi:MAG: TIGR00266 family protein [Candidatus Schekmanbacteria bacterium]|nr:TIGR00266 family protein [Candidatus Schekmanbacteria bacterium]